MGRGHAPSEQLVALADRVRRGIEEETRSTATRLRGPQRTRVRNTSVRTEVRRKPMPHTVEWKVRLYLVEDEGTTKAQVVLDNGTTVLTGHGSAHRNPADVEVPEIGDELAAGRAMYHLARQLVKAAERDIKGMGATGPDPHPVAGWPT